MSPASDVWATPAFLEDMTTWVTGAVGSRAVALDQVHVRPWSTAVRFAVEGSGNVWGKANAVGVRHEPPLTALLARLEPSLVPEVVAIDEGRAWSVTADAGTALRIAVPVAARWAFWEDVLPRYAEAQLRVASEGDAVRATGLPVVTPERMPELLRDLVEELASRPEDDGGLTAEDRHRIQSRFDDVDGVCAELTASGVPSSIQHDDLHGGNVCERRAVRRSVVAGRPRPVDRSRPVGGRGGACPLVERGPGGRVARRATEVRHPPADVVGVARRGRPGRYRRLTAPKRSSSTAAPRAAITMLRSERSVISPS